MPRLKKEYIYNSTLYLCLCGVFWGELYLYLFRRVRNYEKAAVTFFISVSPATWNNSAATGQTFMKFDISLFFEAEKIQVSLKSDKNNDAL